MAASDSSCLVNFASSFKQETDKRFSPIFIQKNHNKSGQYVLPIYKSKSTLKKPSIRLNYITLNYVITSVPFTTD